MDGSQPRDAAQRFVRTTPDPDARPHPCERLARSLHGAARSTAIAARPTQKRLRNPARVYAVAGHTIARRAWSDRGFEVEGDHDIDWLRGRERSTSATTRDGALRQYSSSSRAHVHLGPPSTLVPDFAADAFAVAVAGRVTGYPAALLWARWGGMDCRRIAAALAWARLIEDGEVDSAAPWQRAARRAVLHGITRSLYGRRYARSYEAAARGATKNTLWFAKISKRAQRELDTALAALERAFLAARD